jgi:hypothetical protein
MTLLLGIVCLLASSGPPMTAAHAVPGEMPDRTIQGHTVVSTHDPPVRIQLPVAATYIGADRWLLEDYADDVELHAFVDADADKRVRRIFWVQFEAYLPSRPQLRHRYGSTRHVMLGGMDFLLDTWVEASDSVARPDSDEAHLDALIRSAGYTLPASVMSVRCVHLMDDARKELMLIYSEDTAATGFTADDLRRGGKAHVRWPGIEAALIDRAQRSFGIEDRARQNPRKTSSAPCSFAGCGTVSS